MAVPKRKPVSGVHKPVKRVDPKHRRIFFLCGKQRLNLSEDARREIAGQFRKDKVCSMQGMQPEELYRMLLYLANLWKGEERKQRSENRDKKKRMDGKKSPWASPEAIYFIKQRAEEYWGSIWKMKLSGFLGLQAKYYYEQKKQDLPGCVLVVNGLHYIDPDHPEIPKKIIYNATEALKILLNRAAGKKT